MWHAIFHALTQPFSTVLAPLWNLLFNPTLTYPNHFPCQLERDTKAKEVEASHSHTSALATRKEFLAKSVTELEDLVGRLSGQVTRDDHPATRA